MEWREYENIDPLFVRIYKIFERIDSLNLAALRHKYKIEENIIMKQEDIDNIFTYHKPFGDQADRYEGLRNEARQLAISINTMCPESREKSLAITNLQQAIMWANASIAINEKEL